MFGMCFFKKICIFALLLFKKLCEKMKHLIIALFVVISSTSFAQNQDFDTYFQDNTLNILYYHSGRVGVEYYNIEEIYGTKGWAGSKTNLLDNTTLGAHRIEIYASGTKNLIYSHNYCSLFEEWQTTPEAKNSCGNFEEVIRFPYPKQDVDIVFLSRDSVVGDWLQVEKKGLDIHEVGMKETNKPTYNPFSLHIASEDVSKKLDIVIVPAGYTQKDSLKMVRDLELFTQQFFDKPPFSDSKDKINIRGICYFSEQTGIPGLDSTIDNNTYLGVTYNTFGSKRYIMTRNVFNLHDIITNIPYDQIVIMCNSDVYGGGGIFNFYATSYVNPKNGFVLIHEFGHSFAGLGDEYSENDIEVEGATQTIEPWQKNVTSLKDFSKKWQNMMDKNTPIPTPCTKEYNDKVGVYEGAAYVSKGLYRPYQDCLMKSDKPFCPVCTKEINKMLDLYTE